MRRFADHSDFVICTVVVLVSVVLVGQMITGGDIPAHRKNGGLVRMGDLSLQPALQNRTWHLTRVVADGEDLDVPAGSWIRFRFEGGRGTVSRPSACNTVDQAFGLDGDRIRWGTALSTGIGCGDRDASEVTYGRLLGRTDRIDVDPARGEMVLRGGGAELRFGRVGSPEES